MKARWAKEWSILRWPALLGIGAVITLFLVNLTLLLASGAFGGSRLSLAKDEGAGLIIFLAQFAFAACLPLMAALSFGSEFHHRTMSLLLAQPVERSRVWREKIGLLVLTVAGLGLLWLAQEGASRYLAHRFGESPQGGISPHDRELIRVALRVGLTLFAVVCSAPFWTLVARSTIGGLVFALTSPALAALVAWVGGTILNPARAEDLFEPVFLGSLPVFAGGFLWLGWRLFERQEAKDVSGSDLAPPRWLAGAADFLCLGGLRCRARGPGLNLFRKEVRIHRILAMAAAVYAVCWLIAIALCRWAPERDFEGLLVLEAAIYCPLVLLLAGSLSMGEEKRLGLAEWHLTLPVSVARQWALKLVVGFGFALGGGVIVPGILAWLTLPASSLPPQFWGPAVLLMLAATGVFVISFLAATLWRNTLEAILAAIVCLGLMGTAIAGGTNLAGPDSGLQADLFWLEASVVPSFMDSLWPFLRQFSHQVAIGVGGLVLASVALRQSFRQFGQGPASRRRCVQCLLVLLVLGFVCAFWALDFVNSVNRAL